MGTSHYHSIVAWCDKCGEKTKRLTGVDVLPEGTIFMYRDMDAGPYAIHKELCDPCVLALIAEMKTWNKSEPKVNKAPGVDIDCG